MYLFFAVCERYYDIRYCAAPPLRQIEFFDRIEFFTG